MGSTLRIKAFSGKDSELFKKHLSAVKFCIDNELSYPKETTEFFKGKVNGQNLEDFKKEYVLEYIEDGVEVPMKIKRTGDYSATIKVSDIPEGVEQINIAIS